MISSIGFIGYGNMGSAMAKRLHSASTQTKIYVQEPDTNKSSLAREECGAITNSTPAEFCSSADIILLAVKPQLLQGIMSEYRPYCGGKKIISIAAGLPVSFFEEFFATDQVIRFMPNIAAQVGKALVAVGCGPSVSAEFREQGLEIASAAGQAMELPEYSFSAFTGLCGSGIAYVFSFIHALALGGTKNGIPYTKSLEIAASTLDGAVALLRESGENPISLLSTVISPAGTTIEGIEALEKGNFTAAVMNAVEQASRRAKELE